MALTTVKTDLPKRIFGLCVFLLRISSISLQLIFTPNVITKKQILFILESLRDETNKRYKALSNPWRFGKRAKCWVNSPEKKKIWLSMSRYFAWTGSGSHRTGLPRDWDKPGRRSVIIWPKWQHCQISQMPIYREASQLPRLLKSIQKLLAHWIIGDDWGTSQHWRTKCNAVNIGGFVKMGSGRANYLKPLRNKRKNTLI